MSANHSRFDSLNAFIRKRRRVVVLVWVLALVLSAPLIASFFSSISFNVANGGPALTVPNSESEKAQTIVSAQFPATNVAAGAGPIIVVFQNEDVYSNAVKADILSLNRTLGSDFESAGFTGVVGLYSEEGSLLDSTVPVYLTQIAQMPGSANGTVTWDAAAQVFVNETSSAFASSPLFTVNASSLYGLLSGLNASSTPSQVRASVANLLSADSLAELSLQALIIHHEGLRESRTTGR